MHSARPRRPTPKIFAFGLPSDPEADRDTSTQIYHIYAKMSTLHMSALWGNPICPDFIVHLCNSKYRANLSTLGGSFSAFERLSSHTVRRMAVFRQRHWPFSACSVGRSDQAHSYTLQLGATVAPAALNASSRRPRERPYRAVHTTDDNVVSRHRR